MIHHQLDFYSTLDPICLDKDVFFAHLVEPAFIKKLFDSSSSKLTIDIETYGVGSQGNGLNPYRNAIRLIQVQFSSDEILLLDLLEECNRELTIDLLKFVCYSHSSIKILHNAYFDILNLGYHYQFTFNNVRDTQIMSTMLYAGIKRFNHSLKECYAREFDLKIDKTEQLSDWSGNLTNSQINYAIADVRYTSALYEILRMKCLEVDKEPSILGGNCVMRFTDIVIAECCSIPAFVDITLHGMPVDLEIAYQIMDAYAAAFNDIKAPFEELMGLTYSASPKSLIPAIKEKFNVSLELKSGGEKVETSNASALFIASKQAPILVNLMLARTLKQYLDAISRIINTCESYEDKRLRGWFQVLGNTGSGRSTCSDGGKNNNFAGINLQNIPKQLNHPMLAKYNLPPLRSCIRTKPGKKLVVIDLAASHQRLVASKRLSGDDFLQKVLLDPVVSKMSHAILAADIAKLKGIEITPEELEAKRKSDPALDKLRNISKTRFYSGLNKAGWATVQARLQKDFIECSDADAKASSEAFSSRYPGISEFQAKIGSLAEKVVHLITLGDMSFSRFRTINGRLFHCPKYPSFYSPQKLNVKISDALAIQWLDPEATAMKMAMIAFREMVNEDGLQDMAKLISMCHDELVLEVDEDCDFIAVTLAKTIGEMFQYVLGDDLPHGVDCNPDNITVEDYSKK